MNNTEYCTYTRQNCSRYFQLDGNLCKTLFKMVSHLQKKKKVTFPDVYVTFIFTYVNVYKNYQTCVFSSFCFLKFTV
uniref:Uncharacterized protein n=1 Tax=Anguilla anguilla TaxID=7936 RepID=A0A0E9UHP1_ANGAN